MNYKFLEYFVRVVETRNITKAAEQLFVSQPAVTNGIKSLEDEFGKKLLKRTDHGVVVTHAGNVLYERARSLRRLEAQTYNDVRLAYEDEMDSIVICSNDGPAAQYAINALSQARMNNFGGVSFFALYDKKPIYEMLEAEVIHFGLISGKNSDNTCCSFEFNAGEKLFIVLKKEHPLSELKELHWKDVKSWPVYVPFHWLQENTFEIGGEIDCSSLIVQGTYNLISAIRFYMRAGVDAILFTGDGTEIVPVHNFIVKEVYTEGHFCSSLIWKRNLNQNALTLSFLSIFKKSVEKI